MSVYDSAVALLLMGWLIGSVVVQRERGRPISWFLRVDVLGLLPNYRFFAPRPMSHDLTLYVRCIGPASESSSWTATASAAKTKWCFIWNPEHRVKKAIHDVTEGLQRYDGPAELRPLSYPYLVLLEEASSACRSRGTHVQFVVAASAGFEDASPNLLFVSQIHKLPK